MDNSTHRIPPPSKGPPCVPLLSRHLLRAGRQVRGGRPVLPPAAGRAAVHAPVPRDAGHALPGGSPTKGEIAFDSIDPWVQLQKGFAMFSIFVQRQLLITFD